MKIKTFLIQNILAPYRIKLFETISENSDIDFTLILTSRGEKGRVGWMDNLKNLKFNYQVLPGINIQLNFERQISFNLSLFRYLIKERPDVVITSGFQLNTLFAIIYSYIYHKKMIIWTELTKDTERHRQIGTFKKLIRRFVANHAHSFICAGQMAKDYILSLNSNTKDTKFYLAYNTINKEQFLTALKYHKLNRNEVRKVRELSDSILLLFVGRFVEIKGLKELLNIIDFLRPKYPQIKLMLVGDGPLRKELQDICNQKGLTNVIFEGFKSPEQLPLYYSIADIFVLLSHKDCNPLVIIEALTASLPIVASKYVGNHVEFVKNGLNGFVVDPFDEKEVVQTIDQLITNNSFVEMGKYSFRLSMQSDNKKSAEAFVAASKNL